MQLLPGRLAGAGRRSRGLPAAPGGAPLLLPGFPQPSPFSPVGGQGTKPGAEGCPAPRCCFRVPLLSSILSGARSRRVRVFSPRPRARQVHKAPSGETVAIFGFWTGCGNRVGPCGRHLRKRLGPRASEGPGPWRRAANRSQRKTAAVTKASAVPFRFPQTAGTGRGAAPGGAFHPSPSAGVPSAARRR